MTLDNPTITPDGDTYRLVYEDVYATDIDDLWNAVTDAERLGRWMAVYRGDLSLGGEWTAQDGDGEPWSRGRVTSCDAPHSFTTTWQAEQEDPTDLVVRLAPSDGGTRLTLEHTGVTSIFYGAGWQVYLEQLRQLIAAPESTFSEEQWQQRFGELRGEYDIRFGALRPKH